MQPPTTTTQGTTLEVLAPYLPYGVDVESDSGVRRRLVSLFRDKTAHVDKLYPNSEKIELGNLAIELKYWLPVLRPFNALRDPLPDGTVPIIEVAKIQWPHRHTVKATLPKPGEIHLWERMPEIDDWEDLRRFVYLYESDLMHTNAFGWRAAEKLRSLHFAVGLQPNQFIVK